MLGNIARAEKPADLFGLWYIGGNRQSVDGTGEFLF
jgi:hypothetical protein